MTTSNLWEASKLLWIRTGSEIVGGFDVGFDGGIAEQTKDVLMDFIYWVEDHYSLPVTLWVDFKCRHYLLDGNKKRVAYKFYWVDFETYPNFENFDDIPVIELAVRTEKQTTDEILLSFIGAISHYFAWLSKLDMCSFKPDEDLVYTIFRAYKNER